MGLPISRKSFHRRFNDTVEGMATDIKDTAHAVDAAAVMGLLPARPRLLALGEPTHGEDTLLDVRNELFRQLVEQEGYRTIAIESDCLRGLVVDDYVTSGTGTLDEVMERGFSHGWGTRPRPTASSCAGCAPTTRAGPRPSGSASPVSTARWRSPAPRAPGRPSPHSTPTSRPGWTRTCSPAPRRRSTACSAPTTGGPIPPR